MIVFLDFEILSSKSNLKLKIKYMCDIMNIYIYILKDSKIITMCTKIIEVCLYIVQ